MRHRLCISFLAGLALILVGCSDSSEGGFASVLGGASAFSAEPPLETPQDKLDAALVCTPFEHPEKPPVLLVHGTFTAGYEQYEWTYLPLLKDLGYDVCYVSYPDRGFGDAQISAEYVVNALRRIHAQSGRKVALIGHSQGVMVPRWALKWWPSARNAVDDFVMQAGPNHGTTVAGENLLSAALSGLTGVPEVFFQFPPESQFMQASNRDDETPGDVSYTSLYTQFDELVQPVTPVPTAALEFGQNNPNVSNILLQDVCPGRIVDHVTIGLTDGLAFALTLDAISHPGPASVERAGGAALCGAVSIVPDQQISPQIAQGLAAAFQASFAANSGGPPNLHLGMGEPPLKPYAR